MANDSVPFQRLLFSFILIFASFNSSFTVASHNLHGFKKSASFHKKCIESHAGVWFAQELWLQESQLTKLNELGVNFTAASGMEKSVSSGILRGRPYGGVSIAWSPDLNHIIKPLVNYRHKRIVCVEAAADPHPFLFISLYMPFYDSSKRQECMAESIETISMLEEIISDFPLHKLIIGGDFNTEFTGHLPFDSLWSNFKAKHGLVCCDDFVSNNNYTYIHNSLDQRKWNDHFLISSSIAPSTNGHLILDTGDNTSDHLPILFQLNGSFAPAPSTQGPCQKPPSLKWDKCTHEQKATYTNQLAALLNQNPSTITHCNIAHCKNQYCLKSIQDEYDCIISVLTEADKILPQHKPGVQKHWWSEELTCLRNQSIDIHRIWQAEGKPRCGPTNCERLRIRAVYRKAIHVAQTKPTQSGWNKLHNSFISKNTTDFWRSWKQIYSKNKSDLHSVVNGVTGTQNIADSFKTHFVSVSKPNNQQRVDSLRAEFQKEHDEATSNHTNCVCASHSINVQTVIDAVLSMKKDKCCDDSSIFAEHLFHAPLPLFQRLQRMFQAMLSHEIVPHQFQRGTIVPIVKDNQGDKGDLNNYRGITIAPIISKVFEHALNIVFQPYLSTSSYQFGFKKKSSTSLAIHCLRETINYYTSKGSNVFCSFLDASKAFDRLVHAGLFIKLLRRRVPLIFLNVIVYWYSDLVCRVRWGDATSDWFIIEAGVRQGGVLSPGFYCIYVDELVEILTTLGIGCHLRNIFLSILLYADDMALLSPSLKGLQKLLSATEHFCNEWDIMLNVKKSKNMVFGRDCSLPDLVLSGKAIDWVKTWTYLGVTLKSHKSFNCCIDAKVKAFYRSANAILRIDGRSEETVMLRLLESQSVSILTYALEVIEVADRDERRRLRVAYNSVFRRVFGYRDWESVTDLQHALKRLTWEELVEKRTANFMKSVDHCSLLNSG